MNKAEDLMDLVSELESSIHDGNIKHNYRTAENYPEILTRLQAVAEDYAKLKAEQLKYQDSD